MKTGKMQGETSAKRLGMTGDWNKEFFLVPK
jgi:hypothetical protein